MNMSDFYKNWMRLWAWGVVLFGAAIALFAFVPTEGPMRIFFDLLGKPIPAAPDEHFRFAMGLMGCISVGWGMTYLAAFEAGHQLTGAAATKLWRGIFLSAAVWYVIDSYVSIHTGFWRNAISNSVLAVLFLIPMLKSGVLRAQ
jgi:hypothetical protein